MSTLFLSQMHIRKKSSQQFTALREEMPSWGALKTFFVERSLSRQRPNGGKEFAGGQASDYPVRIYGQLPPDGVPRPPSFIHATPVKPFQEPQPDNIFYESDPFAATPTASFFAQDSLSFSHHNSTPDSTASFVYSSKSSPYSDDRSQMTLARPDTLMENVHGNLPGSQSSAPAGSSIFKYSHVNDSGVSLSEVYTISQVKEPPSHSGHVSPKHRPTPLDLNIPHKTLYDDFQPVTSNQPPKVVVSTVSVCKTDIAGNGIDMPREDVPQECDSDEDTDDNAPGLGSESGIESDASEYFDCIPCSPQAETEYPTTSEGIESRAGQVQVDLGGTQPNAGNSNPEQSIDSGCAKVHDPGIAPLKPELDAIQKAPVHEVDIGTRAANAPFEASTPHSVYYHPSIVTNRSPKGVHDTTRRPRPLKTSESSPHLMYYRPPSRSYQTSKPSSNYPDTVVYFRSRDSRCTGLEA